MSTLLRDTLPCKSCGCYPTTEISSDNNILRLHCINKECKNKFSTKLHDIIIDMIEEWNNNQ